MLKLEGYAGKVQAADTPEAVWDVVVSTAQKVGIDRISYHHLPPIGAMDYSPALSIFVSGFPDTWVQEYSEQRYYKDDPIVARARTSAQAFWWSEIDSDPKLTNRQLHYLKRLRAVIPGDGLALPVFGPNGRNGYCSVGYNTPPDLTPAQLQVIQSVCTIGHLRYCEMLEEQRDTIGLSVREIETMRLMTLGRTVPEIAVEMGIKENTVHTNIRRAYEKLGVSDKVSASLRCVSLGYFYY